MLYPVAITNFLIRKCVLHREHKRALRMTDNILKVLNLSREPSTFRRLAHFAFIFVFHYSSRFHLTAQSQYTNVISVNSSFRWLLFILLTVSRSLWLQNWDQNSRCCLLVMSSCSECFHEEQTTSLTINV